MSFLGWLKRDPLSDPPPFPKPELVPDPDPPLAAFVMICGKCGAPRGQRWKYRYQKANTIPTTVQYHDYRVRRQVMTATLRDECVRVTCTCGFAWNEQTAEKIQGADAPEVQPFPTFMRAWEWLLDRAGHDGAFPLCDASVLTTYAQLAVADSEEGLALYAAAVAKLREQGVLS